VAAWRDPPATPNLMCEPESPAHMVSGDFVFVDDPGFRLGLRAPVLPGGQRHHRVHIGPRAGRDRHFIRMQTIDHRREHRVDRRKIAEEEGASLTKLPAGLPKSLFKTGDIGTSSEVSSRCLTSRRYSSAAARAWP